MVMISRLRQALSRERELQMIWEVERAGRRSYLVGTAHFFPYHFRGSLRRYIGAVETVLFEGPLDEEAARKVVEAGSGGMGHPSLLEALDARTIRKIRKDLGRTSEGLSSHAILQGLFGKEVYGLEWDDLKGLKPWAAFFRIWSAYLRSNGWIYNMELDALAIATEMGKDVRFLETIEEQIEALDNVPFERFVHFLKHVSWNESRREYLRLYLAGDLDGLMARVRAYPTFCDAIIGKRDPVLCERMKPFLEQGKTVAFLGATHCRGIRMRLLDHGHDVQSLRAMA
jgi:hypothetical protein